MRFVVIYAVVFVIPFLCRPVAAANPADPFWGVALAAVMGYLVGRVAYTESTPLTD